MLGPYYRARVLNISPESRWDNLPQAYKAAQHLQDLIDRCTQPSINTVGKMLNRSRLAAHEVNRSYQQVCVDLIEQRELQVAQLRKRMNLIGFVLLALAGFFCATPVVYITLQFLDLVPAALSCLYTLIVITAGMSTLLYGQRVSENRQHWLQMNKAPQFKVADFTASPLPVELTSRFLDQVSIPLSDWIKQLQEDPPPQFAHKGLSGELRLIRNLAGMILTEGEEADNAFVIVVHGLLLDEALDGDVILICSRGIFLLECKDWKGLTEFKAGTWIHMVESDHPDAVHGWLYKEEVNPVAQFKREKKALDHILQAALPDISKDDLAAWQDGGVAFTHVSGELRLEDDPGVPCGDIDFWRQRISDRPPILALDFAMQLQIAQALLNHAARSDDDSHSVGDALDVLSELVEDELDHLSHDGFYFLAQTYLDAYYQLIIKIELEKKRLQSMFEEVS